MIKSLSVESSPCISSKRRQRDESACFNSLEIQDHAQLLTHVIQLSRAEKVRNRWEERTLAYTSLSAMRGPLHVKEQPLLKKNHTRARMFAFSTTKRRGKIANRSPPGK